jgi:hypothetical protein
MSAGAGHGIRVAAAKESMLLPALSISEQRLPRGGKGRSYDIGAQIADFRASLF